ncbi:MAG TPA: hypothetical protein VLY04_16605 [Bryobacteraceae bacterium]|nr:hypothetical protein [Bryobacteraceae bacterium]
MNQRAAYLAAGILCAAWWITPVQAQRHNHNLSLNFEGNAEHCTDLRARSNGAVAQSAETFTLQMAAAPLLELRGLEQGIVKVRGWDRAEYSVETCKVAAADDQGTAERVLRSISVTHTGGRFSDSGPKSDDGQWEVYFIVRAPKNASLYIETTNGPIDIADVSGMIQVRAANGPVALSKTSGVLEAHTTNGPISFSDGGGEVHLTAQNGPIALKLSGDIWDGSQLEARTVNGPLAVNVPDTFRSGIRLETDANAPISCRLSACSSAWRDTGGNQRVLQMNGSNDTLRLSTHNGPVSVSPSRHTL